MHLYVKHAEHMLFLYGIELAVCKRTSMSYFTFTHIFILIFNDIFFIPPVLFTHFFLYFSVSLSSPWLLTSSQVGLCLGSKVESLALPGSSITEASLLALLPRLNSLRRLDLRGLDSLFMSGAFLSREEQRQQVLTTLKFISFFLIC